GHVTHKLAQSETDGQQIEERLEEARQEDQPAVLVDEQVAFHHPRRAPAGERHRQQPKGGHPRTSRCSSVRKAASVPAMVIATRTTTWIRASRGSAPIVPSIRARQSSTPCHSGDNQAIG